MRHARVFGLVGLTVTAVAAVAFAQSTVTPLPDTAPVQTAPLDTAPAQPPQWGDAKRGATLAAACAACHGLDGKALQPNYPNIGGQGERYIAEQLALFKSGERSAGLAALMRPFAINLSPQDMRDLGAHYANQPTTSGVADDTVIADEASPYNGMKFYEAGQQLYLRGDVKRDIPACLGCHGPSGAGNPGPAYPMIGGQDSGYVTARLNNYRAGTSTYEKANARHFEIMAQIAKSLTDAEIASLASFLRGLHDRADEATPEQVAALGSLPPPPAPTPVTPTVATPSAPPAADAAAAPPPADATAPADATVGTAPAVAPATTPADPAATR
ncbi:MAG: cytochrome C [Pseudoxanthomonas suwonensis]|nr:MAG: cytochrome C [Pseudoxanthomonas suwonensis]